MDNIIPNIDYNGLCLIPIEVGIKRVGIVREIINIPYLSGIIDLANRRNLYVLYISNSKGLVEYDDYIDFENKEYSPLVSRIIAEQVYRCCIEKFVSVVYYMGRNSERSYREFLDMIRYYGIEVLSPIMGFSQKVIPKMLELYR